ncbi:MAG TPA: group 1 truncated hemoglobin [Kofleriaceae bacterium]|nr:group 1 truncated hemoglobin [Kofleriaceae bacterium]
MKRIVLALALAATMFGVAAADTPAAKAPSTKSLYDRLGGKTAIQKVVHQFVLNVAADKVINKRFAKTNTKKLEATLVDQVSAATGCTTCKYKGKTMADAHKGMKISEDEWKATVGDLKSALDKYKVGDTEQNELLSALAGMHDDIVDK